MKASMKNSLAKAQISTLAVASMFVFSSCFQMRNHGGGASDVGPGTEQISQTDENGNPVNKSGVLTVSVVGTTNVIAHMKAITGIQQIDTNIQNKYAQKKGMLSLDGNVVSINAPMWIALPEMGAEFCGKIIADETAQQAANRKYFSSVDFTKGPAQLDSNLESILTTLGRQFWSRNPNADELAAVTTGYKAAFAGAGTAAADTTKATTWLCTAMIASLPAVEF